MKCYNSARDCTEATHLFTLCNGATLCLCELCVVKSHLSDTIVRMASLFGDYDELAYGPLFTSQEERQRYADDYAEMLSEQFEVSQTPGYDPKVWAPTYIEIESAYFLHARYQSWERLAKLCAKANDNAQAERYMNLARFEVG